MEQAASAGMEVPELQDRGDLEGIGWLWEAYLELISCRPVGYGAALRIPWTAVQAYTEALGYNSDETYLLHDVVRHLDGVCQDHLKRKRESAPTPGKKQKSLPRRKAQQHGSRR